MAALNASLSSARRGMAQHGVAFSSVGSRDGVRKKKNEERRKNEGGTGGTDGPGRGKNKVGQRGKELGSA